MRQYKTCLGMWELHDELDGHRLGDLVRIPGEYGTFTVTRLVTNHTGESWADLSPHGRSAHLYNLRKVKGKRVKV